MNNITDMKRLYWGVFSERRSELMGLAILIIMIFHWCENYTLLLNDWDVVLGNSIIVFVIRGMVWIGASGVEVFLFLSGIGLYYAYSKKPNLLSFYKKRFVSIIVPYSIIAIPYLLWQNFVYTQRGFLFFLKDYTLITTFTSFNRQGWYVALILILYALFPIFNCVIERFGKIGFTLLETIFILLPFAVYYLSSDTFNTYQVALTRIPVFILGVYCARRVKRNERMKWFPLIMVCFAILMRLLGHVGERIGLTRIAFSRYEKGALILVFLCAVCWILQQFILKRTVKMLLFMAPMTLELYLTHVEIRRMFSRLFTNCWTGANITLAYISIIFISIPIAFIVHKLTMKLLKKKLIKL